MNSNEANIMEIFSSVQGEGAYIGYRQLFIRFTLCNLCCTYCDTVFDMQEYCKVEVNSGSGNFNQLKNPITVEQLTNIINKLTSFNNHSISLTGGEPLLNSDFLVNFLSDFNKSRYDKNLKVYLETNGTLYEELEKVISYLDIISMDFKLLSSTNQITPWDKHKEFIKLAKDYNKEIFVKIVINSKFSSDEIEEVTDTLLNFENIPLILQPISAQDKSLIPASFQLLEIQEKFLQKLRDVRIIPQTHKYLNLL